MLEGNMVIYVHASGSDLERDVILKLSKHNIKYITSNEFNNSIESKILLAFILLSTMD
jgi:hypothetical protein